MPPNKPLTPGADIGVRLTVADAYTISNGVFTDLAWTQVLNAARGITHSTSVDPEEIVVVTPGFYVITFQVVVDFTGNPSASMNCQISKNGAQIGTGGNTGGPPSPSTFLAGVAVAEDEFAKDDIITARVGPLGFPGAITVIDGAPNTAITVRKIDRAG